MNSKIKNLHYLNKYVSLSSLMKEVMDYEVKGNATEGLRKLKEFVRTLTVELVRYNHLFTNQPFPDFDIVLDELLIQSLLTNEQKDLLYSVNDYNPLKSGIENQENLETLRNFCVRIDNELPFIMAHLGIGGPSKNKTDKKEEIVVKNFETESKNERSSTKTVEKEKVEVKTKKPLSEKVKDTYESTPVFVIRFIVVGGLAGVLIYYTFFNKLTSEILNDFYSSGIDEINYVWQYIAVTMTKNLFGLFKSIFDGIAGIFNFLKFE